MNYPKEKSETTQPSQPWAGEFKMIDVGSKEVTHRRAIAQGKVFLSREAYLAIQNRTNPKGNVLALAEMAGILAAKKTSEWIPLCHPLPLDQVQIQFESHAEEFSITVYCEVKTSAKTGVEMEALTGVTGALLSIYDLSKVIDPVITLSEIRLLFKEGGKTGVWKNPMSGSTSYSNMDNDASNNEQFKLNLHTPSPSMPSFTSPFNDIRISVMTISDRASQGQFEDRSGPAIVDFFQSRGAEVHFMGVIPDDSKQIQERLRYEISENIPHLLVTTGGTGLGPRDVTPEAILELSDRVVPGVGECLRSSGKLHTPMAWLSRSLGVQVQKTLVIALPGSVRAVQEGLEALESFLPHALDVQKGSSHD